MAGLGYNSFTAGAVLTAAQVQGYLQDQAVMKFASSSARTSALASPTQGMMSYLTDSNSYWQYYEAYNSGTNPGGASVAGWYPAEGSVLFAGKRNNTGLTLPTGVSTVVTFNTFACAGSTSNTDTIQINSATVPSTFTVRKAGWYQINTAVQGSGWSSTAGTARAVRINRNSTAAGTNMLSYAVGGTSAVESMNTGATVLLAANDVLRFHLYHDAGVNATNNATDFSITYQRPASI